MAFTKKELEQILSQNAKNLLQSWFDRLKKRNPETLYRIKCEDSRIVKNARPAFLLAPTSHFILYKVSGFLFFGSRWNQNFVWKKQGIFPEICGLYLEWKSPEECVSSLEINFLESHILLVHSTLPNCRFRLARKKKKIIHPRCGFGACLRCGQAS